VCWEKHRQSHLPPPAFGSPLHPPPSPLTSCFYYYHCYLLPIVHSLENILTAPSRHHLPHTDLHSISKPNTRHPHPHPHPPASILACCSSSSSSSPLKRSRNKDKGTLKEQSYLFNLGLWKGYFAFTSLPLFPQT
jgi:hypothetical protein